MKNGEKSNIVQSIERALDIIETFTMEDKQRFRVTELGKQVGLPISTTSRILSTLVKRGYIQQDEESKKYSLGLKCLRLGHSFLHSVKVRTISIPYLKELMERTEETANLAILDRGKIIYLESVLSSHSLQIHPFPGLPGPVHSTAAGKVLLAYLPGEEIKRIFPSERLDSYTPRTITTLKKLKEELSLVRKQGFAEDNEETNEGARCIAAPVWDYEKQVVAAISISGPSIRISQGNSVLIRLVKEIARKISLELGMYEDIKEESEKRD